MLATEPGAPNNSSSRLTKRQCLQTLRNKPTETCYKCVLTFCNKPPADEKLNTLWFLCLNPK